MIKALYLFMALFFASPLVTAEIFKCTDGKGNAKYQNFPCPIDSIGSVATAVAPKEDDPSPPSGAARATQPKPAIPVMQASALKALGTRLEPGVGMTTDEVKASTWGEPVSTEISDVEGISEIWHYPDSRFGDTRAVQFDKKGRVLSIVQIE